MHDVGINLELGEDANKNSNCSVDKAIAELETELKKVSPAGNRITVSQLAQSTMTLNNKIRNRGLTAAEVHFSRDSHDHTNLILDDTALGQQQNSLRSENHIRLSRSRAPKNVSPSEPQVSQGDLVYLKGSDSKHVSLDPHLVLKTDNPRRTIIKKTLHSSANADSPLTFSTQTKIVDSKFIFRPTPFRTPTTQMESDLDEPTNYDTLSSKLPCGKEDAPWHPVSDNAPELIPLTIDDDQTSGDLPDAYPNRPYTPPIAMGPVPDPRSLSSTSASSQSNESQFADDESPPSESSDSSVRLFDGDESLHIPEKFNQSRKPGKGDRISYFDQKTNAWVTARITHDLSRRFDSYYNIVTDDGHRLGLYLIPNTRWTLLSDRGEPEEQRYGDKICSLEPSPSSREDHLRCVRSTSCATCHDPLEHMPSLVENAPISQSLPSLDWDYVGNFDTPSYFSSTSPSQVANLDDALPLSADIVHPPESRNLLQVHNLEVKLPLTSTPVPRSRVSRPRRLLPLELPREPRPTVSSFFQKLLPFRKKH